MARVAVDVTRACRAARLMTEQQDCLAVQGCRCEAGQFQAGRQGAQDLVLDAHARFRGDRHDAPGPCRGALMLAEPATLATEKFTASVSATWIWMVASDGAARWFTLSIIRAPAEVSITQRDAVPPGVTVQAWFRAPGPRRQDRWPEWECRIWSRVRKAHRP
jgi:hypothetical protein